VSELRRLELALGALSGSAVALVAVAALDAALHHSAILPVIGGVAGVVVARALASLARQLRGQHRLRDRLRARPAVVYGHSVLIVPGRMLGAFCAGLMRPAIYLTEATLRCAEAELRAVLAHEEHHRRRRDPLRLLLARAISDAFRPLPWFATLADHRAAVADLMADAAAVSATGGARPRAAALARFDEHGAGVAPERVDRLVRSALPLTVPAALPLAAAVALGAIAAPLLLGHHPGLEHLGLLAACLPGCLAARRVGACLRVDSDPANY
jgi:Zn-dependent protease with chaperone function